MQMEDLGEGCVTTPFGHQIQVSDADPLDQLELGDIAAQLVVLAKTSRGFKKVTVILSPENVEQLQFKLAAWIG